ncbi:MAG: M50 family metallopeptidase [Chloroflexota bacterium]
MTELAQSAVTVVLFFVVLGVLVLVHELGHFIVARLAGVRVLEFGIGFPPRAKVLARGGETLYTLNWLPIGGFVKLEGEDGDGADDPRSFTRAPLPVKVLILVAGVAMNVLLTIAIFTAVAALPNRSLGVSIGSVEPGSPAAAAGLASGDTILAIDGTRYDQFDGNVLGIAPIDDLRARAGRPVTLTVAHPSGEVSDVQVTLRPLSDTGPQRGALGVSKLALSLRDDSFTRDPVAAGTVGVRRTAAALGLILNGLGQLGESIINRPTEAPPASGPIGIAVQIGEVFWTGGPLLLLMLAGILSANLALVNILPFPPLDGGRIFVVFLKAIAGTRLSVRVERITYFVGFVLLFCFLIWISAFDIVGRGAPR